MKAVVCYKNVPNTDGIQVRPDLSLDFSGAAWEIGQYDLNAIEAAMSVPDAQVIAMTAAGDMAENSKQKKAVLSRGPEKMVGIKDSRLDQADAYTIAKTLAAAVNRLGDVDLVFFGEGSGDMYSQQTGVLTGAVLGWNTVNCVRSFELDGGCFTVVRNTEEASETLRISLPAVLCVTGDINKPRIPVLKEILAAGKKPLELMSLEELGIEPENQVETLSVLAPERRERKRQLRESADDDSLNELAQLIRSSV